MVFWSKAIPCATKLTVIAGPGDDGDDGEGVETDGDVVLIVVVGLGARDVNVVDVGLDTEEQAASTSDKATIAINANRCFPKLFLITFHLLNEVRAGLLATLTRT